MIVQVCLQSSSRLISTTARNLSHRAKRAGIMTTAPPDQNGQGVVPQEAPTMKDSDGRTLFGLKEGQATVYFPSSSPEEVFYNPGMNYSLCKP